MDRMKHGPEPAVVWIVAGLVCLGVWVNLVGYGVVFLEPASADGSFAATRYAYHVGRLLAGAAFLIGSRFFDRFEVMLRTALPLVMFCGTLVFALSYYQTLFPPALIGSASSLALGFVYMWFATAFYILLARITDFRSALAAIVLSQVIEQILGSTTNLLLGGYAQIALCCACPLAAMLCLARASGKRARLNESSGELQGAARHHQIVLLAISSVAGVGITSASNIGVWGSVRSDFVDADPLVAFAEMLVACLIATALALGTLARAAERPIGFRYQIPFLVIVGSSLFVVVRYLSLAGPSFSASSILMGVEFFSHILTWTIIVSAVKAMAMPAYRIAGVAHTVYGVSSLAWVTFFESDEALSCIVVLVVAFVVVVAVAVHPRLIYSNRLSSMTRAEDMNEYHIEGESAIPLEANGVAVSDILARRCDWLGERYRLSNRERQVLCLLAQGRSGVEVRKRLVLSEGTAKTHISHIYKKMGVSSHQQLLDVVFDEVPQSEVVR